MRPFAMAGAGYNRKHGFFIRQDAGYPAVGTVYNLDPLARHEIGDTLPMQQDPPADLDHDAIALIDYPKDNPIRFETPYKGFKP
ncbi:hypothetical protein AAJCM20276_34210 [Acetobacter aceti]|uniref:Uncharacterized protein n=1 Tax=Acetobacter aceti TaxID=435 RepID=A0A6S6PI61_ACEAC|nr:hypothetical protein AAJCM20276_34210 [Acetobacter aceti]